uniref:Uncharacterized protein n=1 Tax=Aegilops tauschii subsp. strangulata TaxID=200361 RepID=A0A453CG07_AEGTS
SCSTVSCIYTLKGSVRVRDAGGRGADEGAGGVGEPGAVQGWRGVRRLLQGPVPRPRHLLAPRRHRHRHRRVPRRRPLRRRQHALRPQRRRLQQDGRRRRRGAPARPWAAQGDLPKDGVQVRREEHRLPCERGVDELLALGARRVRGRRGRHWLHAAEAGELGEVAGHEARVGCHVVPLRRAHGGTLLREADDAVRPQDAHGPRRHPQELDTQGHLLLPPQLRRLALMAEGPGHVLSARDGAKAGPHGVLFGIGRT